MKRCSKCKETKPLTEFYKNRTMTDGLNVYCKPCSIAYVKARQQANPKAHAAYNVAWDRAHPERKRDRALKVRLGLPYGTYAAMLAAQNGRCGICGTDDPKPNTRFHVDHCKREGTIRGLLCPNCNTGIGQLKHSKVILQAAIAYLELTEGLAKGGS